MSRRFEGVERRSGEDGTQAKGVLKRLSDRQRAQILVWLCYHFEDDGAKRPALPYRPRRRIVLDGIEYWLVGVPKRAVDRMD
jgi:hypothetical protein